MVLAAATLWGVNGTVSKVIIESGGIPSQRLTEVRTAGAFAGLAAALALVRPRSLRLRRRELPILLLFGVVGLAFVQWFYFLAIERLQIGIALLLQYLAPLLVALWARFGMRQAVRRRIWAALTLSLAGLALLLEPWHGFGLDKLGVAAALASAVTFAFYILTAERAVEGRDPVSLVCFGSLFAALFWAVVQPWWSFPAAQVGDNVSLLGNVGETSAPVWLLLAWMIVLGTIVPFVLLVGSLRHITATRAGIAATWEPVAASAVALAWLGETFSLMQAAGGVIVLAAIVLAQTSR